MFGHSRSGHVSVNQLSSMRNLVLTSYTGLLTAVFVACSKQQMLWRENYRRQKSVYQVFETQPGIG